MPASFLLIIICNIGLPPALEAVHSDRVPQRTWEVEFTVDLRDETPLVQNVLDDWARSIEDGQVRQVVIPQPAVTEHFVSERVGATVREINRGDAKGRHPRQYQEVLQFLKDYPEYHDTEDMHDYKFAEPRYILRMENMVWEKQGTGISAHVAQAEHATDVPYDVSTLGMGPLPSNQVHNDLGVPDFVARALTSSTFTDSTEGAMRRIAGQATQGTREWRLEWELDLSRDSQPTRAALYRDDQMFAESRTELTQLGGRWFPRLVRYFRESYKSGTEPYQVVEVQKASFDEPSHRQEPFSPNDIGVALGNQLTVEGASTVMYWDGVELITGDEYNELVYLNGVDPDPIVVERQAKWSHLTPEEYLEQLEKSSRPIMRARWERDHGFAYVPTTRTATEEDPWDLYLERFIAEHKLSKPALSRAEKLLKKAKTMRDVHRRKKASELKEAERAGDKAKIAEYNDREDQIFKKALTHPLDELAAKESSKQSSGS